MTLCQMALSQGPFTCSHTFSALNAGAKRSGATCHIAIPQCCYLAEGAKQPSHTTNTITIDRNPFDPCNSLKRFDLCPFGYQSLGLVPLGLIFFVESFGLKILSQVTTKLSQLHSNSRNKYVNSRKNHNVGHMRCMHARPHRCKDQLPLRSLRDFRSR